MRLNLYFYIRARLVGGSINSVLPPIQTSGTRCATTCSEMAEEKTTPSWTRSIDVETETPVEGIVTGNIPEWMEGTLIRNGSGLFEIGTTKMEHLFDGFSVLHRFAIKKGKATYQNRLLKSQAYLEGKEANRLTIHQYGTFAYPDPCKSVLGKFMSRFEFKNSSDVMTDNCSVNVCYIGDKMYALTETVLIHQIDSDTLETIGDKLDITKYVAVNHSTAHPHVDKDGTVYNMGTTYGGKGQGYNIIQFPPGEGSFTGAKIAATFPARWKMSTGYYHSFGITENYFIFIELPIVLNSLKLLCINLRQQAFSSAMEWYPKERARIMLADRKTGQVLPQIYEAPSFFVFHHGNAYEKDGNVIMDLCHFKDASILTDLSLKNLREKSTISNPYYSRFVLPLNTKLPEDKGSYSNNLIEVDGFKGKSYWLDNKTIMCEPDRLCELPMELPRINYELNGKLYRYVYAVSNREDSVEFTKVVKLNVETRETKEWTKEGLSTSEPVFIARPGSTEEDEGCIIFSAVDLKDPKRVFLVILDAATFHEEATVEFTANGVVTKDFHGIFSRDGDSTHLY